MGNVRWLLGKANLTHHPHAGPRLSIAMERGGHASGRGEINNLAVSINVAHALARDASGLSGGTNDDTFGLCRRAAATLQR
jgi:hypothetical protein